MKIEIKEAGLTKIHSLPLVRQLYLDLLIVDVEHRSKTWGQRITGALPFTLSLFLSLSIGNCLTTLPMKERDSHRQRVNVGEARPPCLYLFVHLSLC